MPREMSICFSIVSDTRESELKEIKDSMDRNAIEFSKVCTYVLEFRQTSVLMLVVSKIYGK